MTTHTETKALVERLRTLADDISPAPWCAPESSDGDVWDTRANGEPGVPLLRAERGNYRSWGRALSNEERTLNAVFVAELRNNLPAILSALEPLTRELDEAALEKAARADCARRVPNDPYYFDEYGHNVIAGLRAVITDYLAALTEEPGHGA